MTTRFLAAGVADRRRPGSARRDAGLVRLGASAGYGLVGAGMLFNLGLCFVATKVARVGVAEVAAVQLAVIALAFLVARQISLQALFPQAALFALYLVALKLFNPMVDLKIGVDFAIMGAFFCLGVGFGNADTNDRFVWWLAMLVLGFGLYELFALSHFEQWFNVFNYFESKGSLNADQEGNTGTTLGENGMRPEGEGRMLLSGLLGLHRVGSVFLEPISAGNFAVICVAWVLARRQTTERKGVVLLLAAAAIGVLADARFSVFSSAAVAVVLLTPFWRQRVLLATLPFAVLALLLCYSTFFYRGVIDNTLAGRLYGSGSLLLSWDWLQWLAVVSAHDISFDSGYSYLIGNIGFLACSALWLAFACRRERGEQGQRFFAAMCVYFSLSLSVSGSSLSIKTAALLWFLYGSLNTRP